MSQIAPTRRKGSLLGDIHVCAPRLGQHTPGRLSAHATRSRATARTQSNGDAAFDPDVVGLYTVKLTVTDPQGASASDEVQVEAIDTWEDGSGRAAPGHVYLLGSLGSPCQRGVSGLGMDGPALVGLDCDAAPEATFVQITGRVWWLDELQPREMTCDAPCLARRAADYPEGDPALNDAALETPCEDPDEVLLGPGHLIARCGGSWYGREGRIALNGWRPFALNTGSLALVRSTSSDEVGVMDLTTGEVGRTQPALSWQFLRAWRSFEDGFRVAAFDVRGRTELVEVGADGVVQSIATYGQWPAGTRVLVGSRLSSAGELYAPVRLDERFQILKASMEGSVESVHDDADELLVRVSGGGELVTGL